MSKRERRPMVSFLRQMMRFGAGSALLFQEKTAEFVDQAMERGQEAEREGLKIVQERRAERRGSRKSPIEVRVQAAIKRMGVPSQQDITELDRRITTLSEHIDKLGSN